MTWFFYQPKTEQKNHNKNKNKNKRNLNGFMTWLLAQSKAKAIYSRWVNNNNGNALILLSVAKFSILGPNCLRLEFKCNIMQYIVGRTNKANRRYGKGEKTPASSGGADLIYEWGDAS